MTNRIGILTNGGDCSGLNSVIRAAFIRAKALGCELIGIRRGLRGLIEEPADYILLNAHNCDEGMLTKAGSMLLSNTKASTKSDGTKYTKAESAARIGESYRALRLNGLIYVGGDGSLGLLSRLATHDEGINIVAIPKTIDNDVALTDLSVGFCTAVEVVTKAVENIRSTAVSHERTMVVEVMGRDAGFIAMYAGVASGADAILVPEFRFDFCRLQEYVTSCYATGKRYCVIVVAEAVEAEDLKHETVIIDQENKLSRTHYKGIGEHIAALLKDNGIDARAVTLGHMQRGGETSVPDRIIASGFGTAAVDAIMAGQRNVMLSYCNGKIATVAIEKVSAEVKRLQKDDLCVQIAQKLGVYIGEL